MMKINEKKLASLTTAGHLLDEKYGKEGTASRKEFHEKVLSSEVSVYMN